MKKKIVFITGASKGIGKDIAIRLASEGYSIAIGYNSNKILAQKVLDYIKLKYDNNNILIIKVNISSRSSIIKAIKFTENKLGDIDILINNAAITDEKKFNLITDNDWDIMLRTNLRGPFIFCQEVLNKMVSKKWGRIVNIVSIGGQWGGVNQVHYACSKAGLIGLTKSLAKIYSTFGITINSIAPGLINTEMIQNEINTIEGKNKLNNIPIGRIGNCFEVSSAVSYLISEESSYITGQTININGGMYFG